MALQPNPPPPTIGAPGLAVRAIALSGGGFNTAMHLGVVHGLLVIQGKAPDAVVGLSTGAVNAVALAEILQAKGASDDPASTQRARVARFREIFEAYCNVPADLLSAYFPDTLQVEAGKSLEPLRLPIHHERERQGRDDELHARQGLIRLFNFLLRTRLTFATLTRLVRRWLGIKAAGQIRSTPARWSVYFFEVFRSWSLVGQNLHHAAQLALELVWRPLFKSTTRAPGTTASQMLFARRWFHRLGALPRYLSTYAVLVAAWLGLTLAVGLLGWGLLRTAAGLSPLWLVLVATAVLAATTAGIIHFNTTRVWHQLTMTDRRPVWRFAGELVLQAFEVLGLAAAYLGVAATVTAVFVWIGTGFSVPSTLARLRDLLHALASMTPFELAGLALLMLAPTLVVAVRWIFIGSDYRRRFLAQFDLADALLSKHPLLDTYVRLFDPGYYGRRNMDDVVERALESEDHASTSAPDRKPIGHYQDPARNPPIAVGLVVASVGSGELEFVPDSESVVNGLYAATAVTPLLPPHAASGRLWLDGSNIASEPTRGALDFLRPRLHPEAKVVHLYSVSPLPFSSPTLRDDDGKDAPIFQNLVDVVRRSNLLGRFRDATLERRLIEIYTRAMPAGVAANAVGDATYLRAWVTPVEPDQPLQLNDRLFQAVTGEAERGAMAEAVAEGCRAALQVMVRESQEKEQVPVARDSWLPCRDAVKVHLAKRAVKPLLLLGDQDDQKPSRPDSGPGLPEICQRCHLVAKSRQAAPAESLERHLHFRPWETIGPAWPHQSEEERALVGDPHFQPPITRFEERTASALQAQSTGPGRQTWPRGRDEQKGTERPLVSLLFSGGVFRGVYQVGTLNALSELRVQPDVIAGASVGSITGAMAAQVLAFQERDGDDQQTRDRRLRERRCRIARLAATYLALDRLILTDRFADFIRGLTLRAGATRFSPAQADRLFRRFDAAPPARFDREARSVIAGLERLFWLSPFELLELVKAVRLGNGHLVYEQIKGDVQEWLERMGVGSQILGAEPLALLISEHVLKPLAGRPDGIDPREEPFDRFLAAGTYFLATTTNLSMGRLEVLGEQQLAGGGPRATLLEGLLASSAFPAVFRPRWSWEVMAGSNVRHQYTDGGLMDNLPLDAVVHFLRHAADQRLISRLPKHDNTEVPHLLFSASLEPNVPRYEDSASLEPYQRDWVALRRRAGQLKYNQKLERYTETQRALRAIRKRFGAVNGWSPLDLEVVTAKPQWLVGTYAFHPMLGFRRDRQAASIAHGCATTLAAFSELRNDSERSHWLEAWGVRRDQVPDRVTAEDGAPVPGAGGGPGTCWFRSGCECPFSRMTLEKLNDPALPRTTMTELDRIHQACGQAETHRARD